MESNVSISPEQVTLLKQELAGKVRATGEYDSIVWRIRSGYLVVLYGILGVLVGTERLPDVQEITGNVVLSATVLLSIIGFSISGFLIDFTYTRSKLRVVVTRDALLRRFVSLIGSSPVEELGRLLTLSGEDPALFEELTSPPDRRGTKSDKEDQRITNDEALRLELVIHYRRRRTQNLWVLGSLYVIAPVIAILIWVVAFIQAV